MKVYKCISAIIFCMFFMFFAYGSANAQSLSVFDMVNLLNSYICKDCSCDEFGSCSCDNCTYDNVTLTEFLSGDDCKCTSCFDPNDNITDNSTYNSSILYDIFGSNNDTAGDNDTSIDDLLNMTCQSCTCDNETVRHLKEMFMNAADFSTCKNKWDLVKFPEGTYLEKCVREFTGFKRWPISCEEAEKVTMLKCKDPNITSLEGLQQFVNLKLIDMGDQGTKIDDVMPLRNLKQLQRLEIPNSEIKNIEYLTRLPMLNTLNLSGNHITDLTYFPYMYPLYQLVLNYQGPDYITDITPLTYMPASLQHLSLQGNRISDISALSSLIGLKYLSIRDNRITSIEALDNMTMLSGIDISINAITDITPFEKNYALNTIIADHNKISSLEPLKDLNKLGEVSFKHNYISDISPVADKTYLKSMIFDFNSITDVTAIRDIQLNTYILSLRFTYNCIPETNYRQIRYLYKIQDVHFENQCENYPPDNVFIDGENIVNVDMITGEVWDNPLDNNTDNSTITEEKDITMGTGCSIIKGKSTGGDIVVILAFIVLLYKIVGFKGRKRIL